MWSWPDVVATLGLVALAILGGCLHVFSEKVVLSLVTAALGYYGARTLVRRRDARDRRLPEELPGEGVPEHVAHGGVSGIVEIEPQVSARVRVLADGTVTIGPSPEAPEYAAEDELEDERGQRTPTDHRLPAGLDEKDKE